MVVVCLALSIAGVFLSFSQVSLIKRVKRLESVLFFNKEVDSK